MSILLSIITVHLDDTGGLRLTMDSVKRLLATHECEWIVVDGGTTCITAMQKGVLDEASKVASHFIAEPDNGIYDAMNKGTKLAKGEFVMYLNAGDELHQEFSLAELRAGLARPAPAMVWGKCIERHSNGGEVELNSRGPAWAWYGMPVSHPAILFKRSLLGSAPYNTDLLLAADYDLVARLLKSGASVQSLPRRFARYYKGGISEVMHNATRNEEHEVRMRHFAVPRVASWLIQQFKGVLRRFSSVVWLRNIWRKRI